VALANLLKDLEKMKSLSDTEGGKEGDENSIEHTTVTKEA